MSIYEKVNLFVACIALVVSVGAIYFSTLAHQDRKSFELSLRRVIALENAKIIAERNVAAINGLLNAAILQNNPDSATLVEAAKLNGEVRDLYLGTRHHFSAQSRQEIDHKLSEVESLFESSEIERWMRAMCW